MRQKRLPRKRRVVALLAVRNEQRFVGACLANLIEQGLKAFLIDHASTDNTIDIARRWLGRGLIGIESMPYDGMFRLVDQLKHKEKLAASLDADWFLHADADEIHRSPIPELSLSRALSLVDEMGFNAVDFQEYTFVPTREWPDHDHPNYLKTMRWYYPFLPHSPHAIRAWKKQPERIDLASSGGHRLEFPGIRLWPGRFTIRHYQFLSIAHARRKYGDRRFDPGELQRGIARRRQRLVQPRRSRFVSVTLSIRVAGIRFRPTSRCHQPAYTPYPC